MADRNRWERSGIVTACLLAGAAACAPARATSGQLTVYPSDGAAAASGLAPLPAAQVTLQAQPDPLLGISSLQTVTLRAQEVEVRALLTALAESAGISLVLDPSIQGRMSVHLVEVPVADALREVLAAANLSVVSPSLAAPWAPVVFYALPLDIETADAAAIAARFGVSAEVAQAIVGERITAKAQRNGNR